MHGVTYFFRAKLQYLFTPTLLLDVKTVHARTVGPVNWNRWAIIYLFDTFDLSLPSQQSHDKRWNKLDTLSLTIIIALFTCKFENLKYQNLLVASNKKPG